MQKYVMILVLAALCPAMAMAQKKADKTIMKALDKQVKCWNEGDLDCFMTTYWQSDSLKFMGSRGITYGWQNTLENYRKAYPDKKAMGELKFDILSMERMGRHYFVVGKFYLTREIGDVGGFFSLVWKKVKGNWVIIADHTSAGA